MSRKGKVPGTWIGTGTLPTCGRACRWALGLHVLGLLALVVVELLDAALDGDAGGGDAVESDGVDAVLASGGGLGVLETLAEAAAVGAVEVQRVQRDVAGTGVELVVGEDGLLRGFDDEGGEGLLLQLVCLGAGEQVLTGVGLGRGGATLLAAGLAVATGLGEASVGGAGLGLVLSLRHEVPFGGASLAGPKIDMYILT